RPDQEGRAHQRSAGAEPGYPWHRSEDRPVTADLDPVLLRHDSRGEGLHRALHQGDRPAAELHPGRHLRRGDALPQGGEGGRHRRGQGGAGADAQDAGQRFHDQERKGPGRRPGGARHVPDAGQDARGIEGRMGPGEAGCDRPRRRRLPPVERKRLPAREVVSCAGGCATPAARLLMLFWTAEEHDAPLEWRAPAQDVESESRQRPGAPSRIDARMTDIDIQDFITRFAQARAARDGEAFLALWHPDGVLHSPLYDRPVLGKELGRLTELVRERAPDSVWQLLDWTARGATVIVEWQNSRIAGGQRLD